MIIVYPKGRLGNHIFIYNFVFSNSSQDELILTIESDFFKIFETERKNVIQIPIFIFRIFYKVIYFFRFFFTQIYCEKNRNGIEVFETNVITKKGLFGKIKIYDGFFQQYNSRILPINKLTIRRIKEKQKLLFKKNKNLIFIHQRNGDYKEFTVYGKKVWLKDNYYKNALNQILNKNDFHFLVFSDDMSDLHPTIKKLKNKTLITGQNHLDDFVFMSLCDGGILSNSTYSYFAGELIEDPLYIIAPKYWLGWKSKKWIPYGIKNPNFTYIDA
jgi:hypothetical protein